MAMKELHLSARAYFKILKIARTIADLAVGLATGQIKIDRPKMGVIPNHQSRFDHSTFINY